MNKGIFYLEKRAGELAAKLSMSLGRRKGSVVVLGEEEHASAPYSWSGGKLVLGDVCVVDSSSLREFSRRAKGLSLCFSPRSLYADIGNFTCVSTEATMAHIRSSVDKIGLFKDDYRISFTKIADIDNLRARYSYLAIPVTEINKVDLLDEKEALLDMLCPIEVAIAAAVGAVEKNMAVVIYEDSRYVRIIGTRSGTIYYLTTINASESFDVVADSISGIREMTSLLKNSYQVNVDRVFKIGDGEVSINDLNERGIQTEQFILDHEGHDSPQSIILFGCASNTNYDFTPERFLQTKRIARHAKVSMAISMALMLISGVLLMMGWNDARIAQSYLDKIHSAVYKNSQELKMLEGDYALLSKDLDLSKVNKIIRAYQDFEAQPKFHAIVNSIAQRVPENVFLTKIDVARANQQEGSAPGRVTQVAANVPHTTHTDSLEVVVEGIINTPYPQSKGIFSSLTAAIQEVFTISSATFSQKEESAGFILKCEIKL